jgi:hypothetical protein
VSTWATVTEVSDQLGVKRNTVLHAVLRASMRGETWVKQEHEGEMWQVDTASQRYSDYAGRWMARKATKGKETAASSCSARWSEITSTPEIALRGQQLEVKTPTIELYCRVPFGCAVQGYDCQVCFMRPPLRFELEAADILRDASVGIGTMVSEHTRPYLHTRDQRHWQVRLGRTTVTLSADEVRDVCACLDVVGWHYAEAVRFATTFLDVWDYPQEEVGGRAGVRLCTVPWRTWQLIQRFAREFAAGRGESTWHCFGSCHQGVAITIGLPGTPVHARLWALPPESHGTDQYIPLLYEYPDQELCASETLTIFSWSEHMGTGAIWTARFTDQWLRMVLVPQVLAHYQVNQATPGLRYRIASVLAPSAFALYRGRTSLLPRKPRSGAEFYIPLDRLFTADQFIPYVEVVQRWLSRYPATRMSTALLRPYYAAIADFARYTRPAGYTLATWCMRSEMVEGERDDTPRAWRWFPSSYEDFAAALARHVQQVNEAPYEYTANASFMSQALHSLLVYEPMRCSPEQFDLVRRALQPLWKQARFDERYVLGGGTYS